jgi:ferredoxin--NADP+ reductase
MDGEPQDSSRREMSSSNRLGSYDPARFGTATIVHRRDVAPELWVIRVVADFDISYEVGQHVVFGLYVDGRLVEHPYSICSEPNDREIELFLERVPGGDMSRPLHELQVGGKIALRRRVTGRFLSELPDESRNCVFVATVTGVAPFVSALRNLRRRANTGQWLPDGRIVLIHGASLQHEFGYLDEMRELERAVDWFAYVPTVSRWWANDGWKGEIGRVEDVTRKYVDSHKMLPGDTSVFLCGHPEMVSNARAIVRRAGFADSAIHDEPYLRRPDD